MWAFILEYKKIFGFLLMPIIAAASLFGYQLVPASSKTDGTEVVNEQMRVMLEHPPDKNAASGQNKPVDSGITGGDKADSTTVPTAGGTSTDPKLEPNNKPKPDAKSTAAPDSKAVLKETPKSSTAASAQPKSTPGKTAKAAKTNLNTASLEKLIDLPEIGETKAKDIIAYREKTKEFNTIEEIMNVKGIGPKTFESLKDFITVGTRP